MLNNPALVATWSPRMLSVLRIVSGYLFLLHGSAKLFGMPHVAMFDGLQMMSLMGLAGVLELVGGGLLLIGLFARPVAFVLSGQMAVAYFMAHSVARACAAAHAESGRDGGPVLLRLPLPRVRRCRSLVGRRGTRHTLTRPKPARMPVR